MIQAIAGVIESPGLGSAIAVLLLAIVLAILRTLSRPNVICLYQQRDVAVRFFVYNREPTSLERVAFSLTAPAVANVRVAAEPFRDGDAPELTKDGVHSFDLVRFPALYTFLIDAHLQAGAKFDPRDVSLTMRVGRKSHPLRIAAFSAQAATSSSGAFVRAIASLTTTALAFIVLSTALFIRLRATGMRLETFVWLDVVFLLGALVLSLIAFFVLYFPSAARIVPMGVLSRRIRR